MGHGVALLVTLLLLTPVRAQDTGHPESSDTASICGSSVGTVVEGICWIEELSSFHLSDFDLELRLVCADDMVFESGLGLYYDDLELLFGSGELAAASSRSLIVGSSSHWYEPPDCCGGILVPGVDRQTYGPWPSRDEWPLVDCVQVYPAPGDTGGRSDTADTADTGGQAPGRPEPSPAEPPLCGCASAGSGLSTLVFLPTWAVWCRRRRNAPT